MKFSSPSALRNRGPVGDVLSTILPEKGVVLEIASGSGEHVTHFAPLFPALTWQPSDPSAEARASIAELCEEANHNNILPPLDIDTTSVHWPVDQADALIAINMVHISPWRATEGLFKGASKLLPQEGIVVLYGPYRRQREDMVASNVAFDLSLRERNPDWGIRVLEDVEALANGFDFDLVSIVDMPANNLIVVFKRR